MEREKILLAEVVNINPYQYEHESAAWIEIANAVMLAVNEDDLEVSSRCAREKMNLMLSQFAAQDRKNLQK